MHKLNSAQLTKMCSYLSYAGKMKCIYIDPPYNIGNENCVYNDVANRPEMYECCVKSWSLRAVRLKESHT